MYTLAGISLPIWCRRPNNQTHVWYCCAGRKERGKCLYSSNLCIIIWDLGYNQIFLNPISFINLSLSYYNRYAFQAFKGKEGPLRLPPNAHLPELSKRAPINRLARFPLSVSKDTVPHPLQPHILRGDLAVHRAVGAESSQQRANGSEWAPSHNQ
jgi:hypothetical protein